MSYGLQVEVWGDYALFSRPELKTERMSYEIITPSAARGLVEAIYWHPGLKVIIDRIYLMQGMHVDGNRSDDTPIKFINVRRNEVKSKVLARQVQGMMMGGAVPSLDSKADIQQRASTILTDVHYVIEAHFEMTAKAASGDNEGKFKDIFQRRLERGSAFAQPYFGCREFPAHFRAWEGGPVHPVDFSKDLGIMLYDMDYSDPKNIRPMYFHARIEHGVMQVSREAVLR